MLLCVVVRQKFCKIRRKSVDLAILSEKLKMKMIESSLGHDRSCSHMPGNGDVLSMYLMPSCENIQESRHSECLRSAMRSEPSISE